MFLRPREVIRFLAAHAFILPGMTVADFGCGGGHLAVLLAAAVGPTGRVQVIDIQPDAIRETRELAEVLGYRNIETHQTALTNVPLQTDSADLVWLSQVLFQNPKQIASIIAEANRVISSAGHLAILEPKTKSFRHGTAVPRRTIIAAAAKSKLNLAAERIFDDNYNLTVFAHG